MKQRRSVPREEGKRSRSNSSRLLATGGGGRKRLVATVENRGWNGAVLVETRTSSVHGRLGPWRHIHWARMRGPDSIEINVEPVNWGRAYEGH
ncbi:phospholipase DDHD1-like protein [Lates japonicus]|uniref:Phospholipase DDHD1-like protein n=1 Tax=Lates japonicus TaxID=270547 RepID=A0AAD3RKK0_LATJO|nr:phospholipase DDHD1-like protein [Lates japonicus]